MDAKVRNPGVAVRPCVVLDDRWVGRNSMRKEKKVLDDEDVNVLGQDLELLAALDALRRNSTGAAKAAEKVRKIMSDRDSARD